MKPGNRRMFMFALPIVRFLTVIKVSDYLCFIFFIFLLFLIFLFFSLFFFNLIDYDPAS